MLSKLTFLETPELLRAIPCSEDFLTAMTEDLQTWELLSTVEYPMSLMEYYGERFVENVHAIEKEFARLEETPILYPNEGARMKFQAAFGRMVYDTNLCEHVHKLLNDAEQKTYECLSQLRYAKRRRTFDKQRKPWQQFLHHSAPGSGVLIEGPAIGSVQMLPFPGLQILDAWRADFLHAARDLGRVSNLLYRRNLYFEIISSQLTVRLTIYFSQERSCLKEIAVSLITISKMLKGTSDIISTR